MDTTTNLRDLAWIDGRLVLFTDDNTNREKAMVVEALYAAFHNAYGQIIRGETGQ